MSKAPDIVLRCDGPGCIGIPTKAPKLYVPAKEDGPGNHRYTPITLAFPHLHYCAACWETGSRLSVLLTDAVKARVEHRGKAIWPYGVKPDFDAALIQPIDVYSPEYGAYMKRIGLHFTGLGYDASRLMRRAFRG